MIRQLTVTAVALCICAATFSRAAAAPPVTVQVRHIDGQHALDVSGTAAAGSPVTVTVYAAISSDLPAAFLNTWTIQPGADGHYDLRAPVAGDFFKGTIITVRAESAGSAASATWIVDRPSSQWIPAADDVPDH